MNNGLFEGWGSGRGYPKKDMVVQTLYTSGFVTPPNEASHVSILLVGGGGGGGGGAFSTTQTCGGGAGGGGAGGSYRYRFPIKVFRDMKGSWIQVVIGAGGTAGTGATVDGTAGTNGLSGGKTEIQWTFPFGGNKTTIWKLEANPGGGGSGGTTTAGGSSGSGGTTTNAGNFAGWPGAAGSTSSSNQFRSVDFGAPRYPICPILVMGGAGGSGKGGFGYVNQWNPPQFFGTTGGGGGGADGLGISGSSSQQMYQSLVDNWIDSFVAAPCEEELGFISIFGGAGSSGGSTTAIQNGGSGGNGWRGTGGGGGSAAGFTGSVGGNGGVGGSGFATFFWEFLK